jgi:aldehyde:ferredoxin oxidoreductase
MMGFFQQPAIEFLRYGTGWDATLEELITVGERRIHLLRAFNAREGIGKAADVLPKRLFEPPAGTGPTAEVALDAEEFARACYYRLRGCDPVTGYATGTRLGALGLGWLADQISAAP